MPSEEKKSHQRGRPWGSNSQSARRITSMVHVISPLGHATSGITPRENIYLILTSKDGGSIASLLLRKYLLNNSVRLVPRFLENKQINKSKTTIVCYNNFQILSQHRDHHET